MMAFPFPVPDCVLTIAPASRAFLTVLSVLFASIIRIWLYPRSLNSRTIMPMVGASLSVGIKTQTSSLLNFIGIVFLIGCHKCFYAYPQKGTAGTGYR